MAPAGILKLYSAFLWFKATSDCKKTHTGRGIVSYGKAYKKDFKNRNKRNYWAKKLLKVGWIEDNGTHYQLKSYQHVWKYMGVEKVNKRGKKSCKGYRYSFLTINKGCDFVSEVFKEIQCYLVDRKKRQILRSIAGEDRRKAPRNSTALLGSYGVAVMLGYKSKSSGHKYRDKYFDVVREPMRLLKRYNWITDDIRPMYPCFSVKLN